MPLRSPRIALAAAAALLPLVGCSPIGAEGTPTAAPGDGASATTSASATPSAAAPAPSPASDAHVADQVARARAMLSRIEVAGRAPKTGYDRTGSYGQAWADVTRSGCGTRDNVLSRDLTDVGRRNACVVISGMLADPYTAKTITFRKADASQVQIDHVVPLALSWQLGAQQWPVGKRVTFANDPLNLLAVDGRANSQKSASGPDAWLPANKPYRCTYVIRFTRVASVYEMRMTDSMKETITTVLDRCTHVVGAPADLKPLPASTWDYAAKFAPTATAATSAAPTAPTAPPTPAGTPAGTSSGESGAEVPPTGRSCPTDAPIKGNIPSDGGDRIYHVPGSRSYSATIPEVCFATAQKAEAAGFRAPR